ncbi:MAG: hypothetical protein EOM68_17270, partial [Spirochaetia bacterium]|nr:hypothetical protein [Spirochaetia bacterium]
MKPAENIITEWVKRGVDDIDRWHYMVAKHAPERNQRIVGDEVAAFIPNSINKKISILKDKHLAEENEAKQVELMGQISQQTALLEFVRNPRYKAVILDMIRYKHSEIFGSKPKRNDALYDDLTTLEYAMLSKIGEMAESKLERVGRTEQTDNRSGFTTQDAIEFVSEFEGKVDNQKEIDDFWGYVKAATRFSLEKSYQHGLLSQEYYERVSSMYEYYVPLRDWEVKENVDYSSIVGRSFESKGIVNVVNKTAKGRSSMSSDPLAQIASMAESAAIWGEKNEVRMAAWRMITENKEMTDLFEIRESWMVNVGEVDGDTQWVQTFDPPTKQMKEAGLAKKGKPNDSYRWHKTNKELEEHEVPVYIDGEYIMMYFKGDIGARVASAINNTAGQDEIGRVMRFTGSATRTMAALATSKNPDFMLTNFVRDYLFGVNAYFIRGGNPAALTANIPIAWKVITQMYSSKAVADTGLKQMYEAFREYGGETGWVHMLGIEKQRKKIEKIVKEAEQAHTISPTLAMRKAYNGLNDALDYLAEMSENAMRFAAFKAEVDKYVKRTGKNPSREAYEKAAIAAKELTTNFNRKGEWAQSVNALYAFANASVQGTANLVSLFKENPARALVSTMTTLMLTVIGPMLIYSVGGDDEKQTYDEMSPYVKDNYFVFPGFGDGKLITIAKPHGFRAITSIGTLMIDGIRNGQEPERVLGDWFKNMLTEVSPFNLVGIDKSPLIIPESIPQFMLTATPTALRPLAEVAFNMNFLGNTIEREHVLSSQEGYLPQYLKAKSNTNPIMVGISKTLNNALGGTDDISARYKYNPETQEVEESALRALGDISPAQVEHLFEGYLGGLGRFFNDAFKTTRSVARGEVPETSNVPVVRRFYQGAWGNPAMDHYYQTKKRVRLMEMYVKAFTKNGQQEDVIGLLNFRNSQVMAIHNQYDKMIKET